MLIFQSFWFEQRAPACSIVHSEVQNILVAKGTLLSECWVLNTNSNPGSFENTNQFEIANPSDDFFVSYHSRHETRRKSADVIIEDEVDRYLDDDRKDIYILNEYPNIRNVFFRHNATLPASAAIERVFSQSSIIFTPRRNRLLAENFERILFQKINDRRLFL